MSAELFVMDFPPRYQGMARRSVCQGELLLNSCLRLTHNARPLLLRAGGTSPKCGF